MWGFSRESVADLDPACGALVMWHVWADGIQRPAIEARTFAEARFLAERILYREADDLTVFRAEFPTVPVEATKQPRQPANTGRGHGSGVTKIAYADVKRRSEAAARGAA